MTNYNLIPSNRFARIFFSFGLITLLLIVGCKREPGCTDPQATNYDEDAKEDCECCVYGDFIPPTGSDMLSSNSESPAYFRMLTAVSDDGYNWTKTGVVVSDQANVPDMVQKDGKVYLYYTGWTVGNEFNTTALATIEEGSERWFFYNLTFTDYPTGGEVKPVDPDVILLPNGDFRMYATAPINGRPAIVYFESSDGINFEYKGVALSSATEDYLDSNTFYYNNEYHMFAINGVNAEHYYFTSTDGKFWTIQGSQTFYGSGNEQHFISNGYETADSYRIFGFFLPDKNINSFTSSDMQSWFADPSSRLEFDGATFNESEYLKDPAIVQLTDGSWLMVYVSRIP